MIFSGELRQAIACHYGSNNGCYGKSERPSRSLLKENPTLGQFSQIQSCGLRRHSSQSSHMHSSSFSPHSSQREQLQCSSSFLQSLQYSQLQSADFSSQFSQVPQVQALLGRAQSSQILSIGSIFYLIRGGGGCVGDVLSSNKSRLLRRLLLLAGYQGKP